MDKLRAAKGRAKMDDRTPLKLNNDKILAYKYTSPFVIVEAIMGVLDCVMVQQPEIFEELVAKSAPDSSNRQISQANKEKLRGFVDQATWIINEEVVDIVQSAVIPNGKTWKLINPIKEVLVEELEQDLSKVA